MAVAAIRRGQLRGWQVVGIALRLLTIAGLAVDAYVHADLAGRYDLNQGNAAISQGDLFRVEAGVSALAAAVLVITARPPAWVFAFGVAASALGGLLLYLFFDGAIGPLPNMYEPTSYPEKTLAAVAEGIAALTALAGLGVHVLSARKRRRPPVRIVPERLAPQNSRRAH